MASASANRWLVNATGSMRPAAIRSSSVGTLNVSTSPVVIVTPLIHSSSRWSVTGWPWTPTLASRPPGRTSSQHCWNVSGMPTASMTTSAPRPSVSWSTACLASSGWATESAPNRAAAARRASAGSITSTWRGVYRRLPIRAARPIGPAPTMATTSAGWTSPLSTPTS